MTKSRSRGASLRAFLQGDTLTVVSLAVAFILLSLYFASQTNSFLSVANASNIGRTLAVVGIASIGMTLALITRGVDLSVGSVAALSGVLTSAFAISLGVPVIVGALFALLAGGAVGLVNGLTITVLRVNPLITTLATFSIVRGLAYVLSGGHTNMLNDPVFALIGRGRLFGLPASLIAMIVLYVFFAWLLRSTPFGRNLYAIGGSPERSRLEGIRVERHLLAVYGISGLLAAYSGLIIASQLGASAPRAAIGLEFTVVTAVVLGGTSLAGGKGTLMGTLVGVIILRTLDNGLVLMQVSSFFQEVARGAVLLLAVSFDQLRLRLAALASRWST
jgi:ribose transport system permease protein